MAKKIKTYFKNLVALIVIFVLVLFFNNSLSYEPYWRLVQSALISLFFLELLVIRKVNLVYWFTIIVLAIVVVGTIDAANYKLIAEVIMSTTYALIVAVVLRQTINAKKN